MTYKEYAKQELGYDVITTYWDDFSIAERFGEQAIRDTYKSAMENEKDYKVLTEICMILNHKIWFLYESNEKIARVYNTLWEKCNRYLLSHLKGEALDYFARTTD